MSTPDNETPKTRGFGGVNAPNPRGAGGVGSGDPRGVGCGDSGARAVLANGPRFLVF